MDQATSTKYKTILSRYLHADAVDDVFDFMNRHSVDLHITRNRRSKLGDYRWPQNGYIRHAISVNGSLNPYMFLLVMLHEQAHLLTYLQYRRSVQPHGHEWQDNYRRLLLNYAAKSCFPKECYSALKRYTAQLPLYRPAGNELEAILRRYDENYSPEGSLTLSDLPLGAIFRLKAKPELKFKSMEKLRTRYRCLELHTAVPFFVAGKAQVVRDED